MLRDVLVASLVLMLAATTACPSTPVKDDETPPPPPPEKPTDPGESSALLNLVTKKTWTNAIREEKEWLSYSKQVGNERFVKAVVDLKSDNTYYFDVNVYRTHVDFAFREFYVEAATAARRRQFNKNYTLDKPDFVLITLVNHLSSDVWTFSFWEGDQMKLEHVHEAYNRVNKSFYMAPKIRFRPAAPAQEELAKKLTAIPVITNDSLYRLSEQHTFNVGRRVGILRIVRPGADYDKLVFQPHEIVILTEPLPDITAVSGLITERFTTPLAHVNLRAAAWGIPHLGLRDASKKYAKLAGTPVLFEATRDGHTLRAASKDEATLIQTGTSPTKVTIPRADLKVTELLSLKQMKATQAHIYGAKAANLGEIAGAKLPGVAVPPGFGIPIAYSAKHIERHGLNTRIDEMLADAKFKTDGAYRKEKLAALRKAIEEAPLDPELLDKVWKRVEAYRLPEGKGVFVRSSTNAEDLPGFTGAGLYTTVANVIGKEALGNAIRKVWASIWNYRAYEERAWHSIDHKGVHGAILVQVGINATAAGVLISTNTFDARDRRTYTINAKGGLGMRVVGGKKIPEQILYNREEGTIKVLSRSDETTMLKFDDKGGIKEVPIPKGQTILTDQRVYKLGEASAAIADLFRHAGPIDIEWLFEGEDLYIVQARPFVMR